MYLNFDEYILFGGKLERKSFDRYSFRAEREIDQCTQGRLISAAEMPEAVKRCIYELVEYMVAHDNHGTMKAHASESNDGVSVSFNNNANVCAESEIYGIIYTYLADTGLMRLGVD